jgi:DNA-directed RNA polymerase specialized sigma24 family protein
MSRVAETLDPGPYSGLPGFKTGGTSREAARAVAGEASNLRERAHAALAAAGYGGLTADQVALALGRDRLSVRPRLSEMAALSRIVRTGERRRNESGLSAAVWRVAP